MATAHRITTKGLMVKWHGKDRWLSDGGQRGSGRLVARIGEGGATFYFQYFDGQSKKLLPIGPYESNGKAGWSLQGAIDRANELSKLYRDGTRDLHEHFERERAAAQRERKRIEDEARRAEEASKRSTLRQLLDAYVSHLERAGKESAGDVRRIVKRHIYDAAPELAERRAAEIPVDEFVTLIGQVVESGKGRTAAKLRSYLRAAFALAIKSKTDPAAPLTLRAFGIETNPITAIGALSQFNQARTRNLSPDEFGAFLRRLEALPEGVKRDAVALCVLLGGQRHTQLVRARPVDVDLSAGTVTLYDSKGNRSQPRQHVLPLTKRALGILQRRLDGLSHDAKSVFAIDDGAGLHRDTVSEVVAEISSAMVKAKESREAFQMRDLRRTCETRLAALGISRDLRGQLQSHGLGGIQARHYDQHDYLVEKRRTLEKWQRYLDQLAAGKKAEVTSINERRVAK